ncbi:MAG: phage tail tip fiber protein [Yersinia sp. (in: enterobacteria)]
MRKSFRAGRDMATVLENIEIMTGQRGDGRDRVVTYGDLAGLNLAKLLVGAGGNIQLKSLGYKDAGPAPAFPSHPKNFTVNGGFSAVLLEWDMPDYRGHALTEIYRSTEDNLANAVMVASSAAAVYGDPVDPGWKGYYWIRFVNSAGVPGPYNNTVGTFAETQPDIDEMIDLIDDEINNSPLIGQLTKEITETNRSVANVQKNITTRVAEANKGVIETNQRVVKVQQNVTHVLDNVGKLEHKVDHINKNGGEAFQSIWSTKASASGITAGIGIVAGKDGDGRPLSHVAVSANQFFVFDPNNPTDTSRYAIPFSVSNGKVVIVDAVMRDAIIKFLKAENIVADKVKAGISLTTPILSSATINNGKFQVDAAGNLKIGDLFRVSNTGRITIRQGTGSIGLVITNERIEVYDENGALMLRLGKLDD